MDHGTRIEIARQATDFVRTKHPSVVAVDLHGSTAKDEDRDHSDLEMAALTRNAPGIRYYQTIHRGIVIEVTFLALEDAMKEVRDVRQDWGVLRRRLDPLHPPL